MNTNQAGKFQKKSFEISYEYNDDALFCCRPHKYLAKYLREDYSLTRAAIRKFNRMNGWICFSR